MDICTDVWIMGWGVGSSFEEESTACAKTQRKRDHVAGGTESCSVWLQLTVGCYDRDVLVNHWSFNTEECEGAWFAFYKELQLEEGSLVLSFWSMVWLWNNLYELKPKRKTDIILKVFKWGKLNERTLLRTGWGPHSLLGAERREDKYPDLSHFLPADLLLVPPMFRSQRAKGPGRCSP